MTNSTRDFFAIEFPEATPAEAAILAQECAAKLNEEGVDPGSIQIARTSEEAMGLGGLLLVLAPLGYAFLEGAAKSAGGEAGKDIYKKIKDVLGTLSRRHRTTIQIKGAEGNAETIGDEFQTTAPSGKGGAGLGKLGVVLLGASEFPLMNDPMLNNPAFGRSAALAKTLFGPPHTAFAKTEVLDLFDQDISPVEVLDAIEQHVDAHPDMRDLLIYYCGHGGLQQDKTYYLLLRSTRKGRESGTGFAPRVFRHDLEPHLINKRVYFVMDCCFSGAIVESLQSGSLENIVEEQLSLDLPRRGWTVLAASSKDKVAMAPKGETYTMFTGALAHVIEQGTPAAGVRFNLLDLADAARSYVVGAYKLGAVTPHCFSPRQEEGDIARLPIFLNKHKAKSRVEEDGGRLPGDSRAPVSKPAPVVPVAGLAEREWNVLGLDASTDPGLLLAFVAKWEKGDPVWAYRARKAAEALEVSRKQQEAAKGRAAAPAGADRRLPPPPPYLPPLPSARKSGMQETPPDLFFSERPCSSQEALEPDHAPELSLAEAIDAALEPYDAPELPPFPSARLSLLHHSIGSLQRPSKEGGGRLDKAKEFVEEAPVAPVARETQAVARPSWASDAGRDEFGLWAEFSVGDARQVMRWMEPGAFRIGSPRGEDGRFDNEGPQHEVRLTRGFWLGDTPVMQALWTAVMGGNPSFFVDPNRPVERVSWDDAHKFLNKMNVRVPGLDLKLPTEAQWEYACRAGTNGPNYAGDAGKVSDIAWFYENSGGQTHPVATKPCNDWGLYDMLGNVWEWCADGRRDYAAKSVTDPVGPLEGASRALRGGSWNDGARFARAARRYEGVRGYQYDNIGFRCCA